VSILNYIRTHDAGKQQTERRIQLGLHPRSVTHARLAVGGLYRVVT